MHGLNSRFRWQNVLEQALETQPGKGGPGSSPVPVAPPTVVGCISSLNPLVQKLQHPSKKAVSPLRYTAARIQGRHCLAGIRTTGGASHSMEKRPLHRGATTREGIAPSTRAQPLEPSARRSMRPKLTDEPTAAVQASNTSCTLSALRIRSHRQKRALAATENDLRQMLLLRPACVPLHNAQPFLISHGKPVC